MVTVIDHFFHIRLKLLNFQIKRIAMIYGNGSYNRTIRFLPSVVVVLTIMISPNAVGREGMASALSNGLAAVQAGPRDVLYYNAAQQVRITRRHAVMAGFRFGGQYSRGYAPTFPLVTQIADLAAMKGAEAQTKNEAWYAVFACANDGDASAVLRLMPYLRLGTPSQGVFPTVKGGEGFNYSADTDYPMAVDHIWKSTNNLVGTEALLISENAGWSGRVTTVAFNDNNEISFKAPGSLTKGDFVLVAPPNCKYFVWLVDFYRDTAEVRNIYDSGFITKSKMINVKRTLDGSDVSVGEYPSGAKSKTVDMRGYISPLATMGIIDTSLVLNTASTGSYTEYYDGDGSAHIFDTRAITKSISGIAGTVVFSNIQVPFLYHQSFVWSNAGGLAKARANGQFNVTGWAIP